MKRLFLSIMTATSFMVVNVHATCVTSNNNPGCLHFEWKTSRATDQFTNAPSTAQQQWFQQHFTRILGYAPYWNSRLKWFPNSWGYQDSSSIYKGSAIVQQHPEFVLRDQSGSMLYINYGCGGGSCPQYAPDYSNEAFRQWWIAQAQSWFQAGYRGLFIDDVNLSMNLSNGISSATPTDNNTGQAMTQQAWEKYLADFLTEIRQAFPSAEICHNALWFSGNPASDPYVAQEVAAANYINLERGYDDTGLSGDGSFWSIQNLMAYIDAVHSKGTSVLLEQYGSDGTQYALAGYLLTGNGSDLFADDSMTPTNWWSGYDIDLGTAKNGRFTWNGLIRRDFANGMALMNPAGKTTIRVDLGGTMTNLANQAVSSVTLAGGTGAVLLGTPPEAIQNTAFPNGIYTIRNAFSGWVLDDPNWSTQSGTQVIQWAPNGGNNQKWVITSGGNGFYMIMNYFNGLYLNSQNGKTILATANGLASELWSIKRTDATYVLINKYTGDAIDDPACSLIQGVGMLAWWPNGGRNQAWIIQ